MATDRHYDPATEVQKLRDHLGSHEKPIVLLFGAGTSSAVEATDGKPLVPAVAALTELCKEAVANMGDPYPGAWDLIEAGIVDDRRNIEEILSSVRRMIEAILDGDKIAGLDRDQLCMVEERIKQTIAEHVIPAPDRVPDELPQDALGRWIYNVVRQTPVEIFTLNYDSLVERALESAWVPVFDGFVGAFEPFFSAASLTRSDMSPGKRWTRLWKLHGSVTWSRPDAEKGRVVRGPESTDGEMILPSLRKYDESRKQPYLAMLDRLRAVLTHREEVILIATGYSYSDQHVNEILLEALDANPGLHIFFLCFSQPDADDPLVVKAREERKLVVLGPDGAMVGGQFGKWRATDPDAAKERLEGLFEFDGGKGPEGKLKLGDFNVFCLLLDSLARQDDSG
jgi:SIR2-like domain